MWAFSYKQQEDFEVRQEAGGLVKLKCVQVTTSYSLQITSLLFFLSIPIPAPASFQTSAWHTEDIY